MRNAVIIHRSYFTAVSHRQAHMRAQRGWGRWARAPLLSLFEIDHNGDHAWRRHGDENHACVHNYMNKLDNWIYLHIMHMKNVDLYEQRVPIDINFVNSLEFLPTHCRRVDRSYSPLN